jgi:hypothetical protein
LYRDAARSVVALPDHPVIGALISAAYCTRAVLSGSKPFSVHHFAKASGSMMMRVI